MVEPAAEELWHGLSGREGSLARCVMQHLVRRGGAAAFADGEGGGRERRRQLRKPDTEFGYSTLDVALALWDHLR